MEGIGSRTGRPSSRYGSAPVFTGPVRRWQKQWVHVSSSSSSITYNHSNTSSNSNSNSNNASTVRIRRWTPVPSAQSDGDAESAVEERPRRKLRYAPIVVVEKKKESERTDVDLKEASKTHESIAQVTSETDNERSFDDTHAAKSQVLEKNEVSTKDLNNHPMDMEEQEQEHDEDHDLGGANKVADWVKAAQRGFAR